MKHFCQKCGNATIYALALPKFCSQCGSEFSLVTKQKDKSVHDQALEKSKEKYSANMPNFVPQPKPAPKNHPNPARASFSYKLVDGDGTSIQSDDDYEDYDDYEDVSQETEHAVNASIFKKIKPKFQIHNIRPSSESFENLITEGYVSNYKPSEPSEIRSLMANQPSRSQESILEEFKREASKARQD
jgi:predicted  nucleic acid-binding Zn-ribbon protein